MGWNLKDPGPSLFYQQEVVSMHIKIAELVVAIVSAIAEFVKKMDE